jgi:translation initiation factor IF-3
MVSRFEALRQAEESGMDLVQVAYDAVEMMATAKIVDFGKQQYEKKKSDNEKKKASKSKGQKELKFGYNI